MKKAREFNRAYQQLLEMAKKQQPLPSVRKLASDIGVSTYTVWLAIDKLRKEGIIAASAKTKPRKAKGLWKQIADKIEEDVLRAAFDKGKPLPSLKVLQARYHVSYPTIRKALAQVYRRGFIKEGMGGYFVPPLFASEKRSRIILLRYSTNRKDPVRGVLDNEFARLLETHCAQARIQVEHVGYVIDNDKAEFVSLHTGGMPYEFADTDTLLGIMHIAVNRESAHASVFAAMARIGRPVSILDEIGGWYTASMMPRNLQHRIISVVSGKGPGHDMAHYLIEQGYKSIAYFSPFYSEQWSQSRYSGLTDIFSGASSLRAAHLFPIEGHERIWSYFDDGFKRAQVHEFVKMYSHWLEKVPEEFAFTIEPLLRRASREQTARGEIYVQLVPLFEQALLNKDIRAWVFDGDAFALMALDFLRKRGVAVPKRIALVSFNDSLDALDARLTSYHFNVAASLNAMLDFIASPSSYRWKRLPRVVEIRGTVIKRDTG